MNLTEFLKYYRADNKNTFGEFVRSRRCEMGYSVRQFASILGISAMYLSDIENGARPAPTKLLPIFLHELHIEENEREAFFDLVDLSLQNWQNINEYLTKRPDARKFLKLAQQKDLSNDFFKQLSFLVEKGSEENSANRSYQTIDDIAEKEE